MIIEIDSNSALIVLYVQDMMKWRGTEELSSWSGSVGGVSNFMFRHIFQLQ